VDALIQYSSQNTVALDNTLAIGDGANDLPMLQASGLGVAYHAKPAVNSGVRATIRFNDLTAALYYQGLNSSSFTSPTK
jgi:phosphoserine phosphatase